MTTNVNLNQRLPWFGTSYSIGWDTSHTSSDSFLNSYNPLLRSGLSMSFSQPLFKDLFTDTARTNLAVSHTNRAIADTRLQETVVRTTAAVKAAYWNLVSARANVEARHAALRLAEELVRVNKAKVDVGQSPPIDLLSAQAEVASNQEQLIVAETAVKQSEDRLRLLIFDAARRDVWNIALNPTDTPPVGSAPIDMEAAVTNALRDRVDLTRARKDVENAKTNVRLSGNQKLPDVRLNGSYQASGLGGTEVLRTGGFPGTIVGSRAGCWLWQHPRSVVSHRLPDVGARPQRVVPDWPGFGRSQPGANPARVAAGRAACEGCRGPRHPAGTRRCVESRDERPTR